MWTVISLAAIFAAISGQIVLFAALQGSSPWTLYLLRLWNPLFSALGWAGILVAVFGGRRAIDAESETRRLQFSIRNLLILTLFAGIVCGVLRGLIVILGDYAQNLLVFLGIIPLLFVWPVAAYLACVRHRHFPGVANCVFGAIGLDVVGWLLSLGLIVSAMTGTRLMTLLLPVLSLLWPLMSVVKWVLLLCAAFGWRAVPTDLPPPGLKDDESCKAWPANPS